MHVRTLLVMGISAALMFCTPAPAQEPPEFTNQFSRIETLDGKVFVNVKPQRKHGKNLIVMHSQGVASIPLTQVPEAVLVQLGIPTPEEEEARIAREWEEGRAAGKEALANDEKARIARERALIIHTVRGTILQTLPKGLLLTDVLFHADFPHQGNAPLGEEQSTDGEVFLKANEPQFVYTDSTPYADGDLYTGLLYSRGFYTNVSSKGAKKVRAYTSEPPKLSP